MGKWKKDRNGRRGLRGTWVPLFYDYRVIIGLVSEGRIKSGKM
jgi:hypothetical protein